MIGYGLAAASLATGIGAGALGASMMVSSSGSALTTSTALINALGPLSTGLALSSSASFALGGDYKNAAASLIGFGVGRMAILGRATYATKGLVSTGGKMGRTLFRSTTTGRTVANSVYGIRFGGRTVGGAAAGYAAGMATKAVIDY